MNLQPSHERVEAIIPQAERYYGAAKRGPVWDWLLREYYYVRVFADVTVERILAWPSLDAAGGPQQAGAAWPGPPGPQRPPASGTGPRRRGPGRRADRHARAPGPGLPGR